MQNRSCDQFYQFSQHVVSECEQLMANQPCDSIDVLSDIRKSIKLLGQEVKKINDVAMAVEKILYPYTLTIKSSAITQTKVFQDSLELLNQKKLALKEVQEKIKRLEEKYSEESSKSVNLLLDLQNQKQKFLESRSDSVFESIVSLFCNCFVSDVPLSIDNRIDRVATYCEDLKTNFIASIDKISPQEGMAEIEIENAKIQFKRVTKQLTKKIELQKSLYFSAVSTKEMLACLRIYVLYRNLCDQIQNISGDQNNKTDNYIEQVTRILLDDTQKKQIKSLQDYMLQQRQQMAGLLKQTWCPESGSRCGTEIYENLSEDHRRLLCGDEKTMQIEKILPSLNSNKISLQDLNTKLVELPSSLVANFEKNSKNDLLLFKPLVQQNKEISSSEHKHVATYV